MPGSAVFVTTDPDGSVWALSNDPAGADKYIWHYTNGTWTNIPGSARRLSVAPDGTVWAVTQAGGIYTYTNGAWQTVAGGASDVSVGPSGVYVISNQPGSPSGRSLWIYSGGTWTQLPGEGTSITASWDGRSYSGLAPYGFYVTNAYGEIYHYNGAASFVRVAGTSVQVAPTKTGGLFALGVPPPDGGAPIFYQDLVGGPWAQQPGAATNIATDGTRIYAVTTSHAIFSAPVNAIAPAVGYLSPRSGGTFAGMLQNIATSATIVGISTDELIVGELGRGQLQFALGSTALSTGRRPMISRTIPNDASPHGYPDRAVEGPANLESRLPGAIGIGSAASASRRPSVLGTTVGTKRNLWVAVAPISGGNATYQQVPATLQAITNRSYLWIADNIGFTAGTVATIAAVADNAYESVTAHYGPVAFSASSPGVANLLYRACDANGNPTGTVGRLVAPPDDKVNVFLLDTTSLGAGVGGYFTSTNYVPQSRINCGIGNPGVTAQNVAHSNEAPMYYVGWNSGSSVGYELNEDIVRGTAHELQHLVNFVNHVPLNNGPSEDTWINEGMSMLAQDFALNRRFGLAHDVQDALWHAQYFTNVPENYLLTAFSGVDPGSSSSSPQSNCTGCYGVEYLFQRYLYDRFGGDAYLHLMLGTSTSYLGLQQATGRDPAQLVSDFAMALAASGTNATSDPRFSTGSLNLLAAYADQFGGSRTVGAPNASALPASTAPYLGSFVYYSVGPYANGQIVSGKDAGGNFGLKMGVVQR